MRADYYELLLDEPNEDRFELGYMNLQDVVEIRIGKEIKDYAGPDDFSTTTTLTVITKSNAFLTIMLHSDHNLTIYEGNTSGRVVPVRRYVPIEA